MKHRRLAALGSCLLMLPAGGQTSSLQDVATRLTGGSNPTTIYTAKTFLTMNPRQPKAEAVAVKNGKFLAVGSLADVRAIAGDTAEVDRSLAEKTVIAGFVEQHVHPVLGALTMANTIISIEDWDGIDGFSAAVRDPAGYEARLKAALESHRRGGHPEKPFVTWGYHHYMHGNSMSRSLLNTLAPDFPAIVWHRSGHELFFNDRALQLAKIDKTFVDGLPEAARSMVNFERGHFFEQGMLAILANIAPIMATRDQFVRGLKYTEEYYHRNGITTCCEPGGMVSKPIQDLVNSVYSDAATPFNHYFIMDGKTLATKYPGKPGEMLKEGEAMLGWGEGRTAFLPKQAKLFCDGAIFSQLMMMKDGYTDGHHGAFIMDPPSFGAAFQAYWDADYQIHVHNNGDGGLDVVLGELEKAIARRPRSNHRTVLVHFGFARPEQVEKWIALGGIISSNPYYVTALAGRYGKLGMTEEWAQNMVPHGDVLKHNGSLSFHSDMPMAPAKPMQLVWAAVNRLTFEGAVAGPQHRVPLDAALSAVTLNAAYSIQLEDRLGSIEIGKDANLTVLDQNPYEVEPAKLKDITVWGTMLEGRMQPAPPPTAKTAASPAPSSSIARIDADSRPRFIFGPNETGGLCTNGCSCRIGAAFATAMAASLRQ